MKKRLTLKLTIFICLILAGLAFTVYPRLKKPAPVQAATSASKTITITNTGSEQTNYDVLVEVDTASLISAGNMQSDCDDIRLYDSNDTTALSYWIESGCNTATTQLWIRVPTVPNGAKGIYLHYNDPAMANGEESWSGNFILMNNTNCPSGWTRNTSFDSRFPYGASSYGGTGGASNHNHSGKIITSGGGSGGGSADGPGRPAANHTHNLTIAGSSTTALPPYLNMVFCQKTDLDINSGLIALFDASVPSGWTRFSPLDSKFPQGASSYSGTGGSTTHTHTITHSNVSGYSHLSGAGGTSRNPACPDSHIHTWSNTTSGSTSNLPPYLNMIFGSQNSTGVGSPNMISMFTALPPLGWTRFSTLDSKFPQGSSSYGGTGGASSHTHSASRTSGGPSSNTTYCLGGSHGTYSSSTHAHSYSSTTNSASSLSPYLNTIFGKRNNPASIGITAVPDSFCNPDINDTAHTITTDCSFSTSRGTDTNGKTVYGMDPGTDSTNTSVLTVQAGTLTITDASNIVLGSISMTGGSIAINTGGQITVGGGIYYEDADADGYPATLTVKVAHSPPTNHRRRAILTTTTATDCNNSDNTKYQNLTGYTDSDADGYGTGNSQQVCSGSTLASGYADNGNDCNDNTYSAVNSCQQCSGGTETVVGGDRVHKFTSSGTLTCNQAVIVQYLIVAGGGGGGGSKGGWGGGGGGGAGGNRQGTTSLSATSYPVLVGAGGAGGTAGTTPGTNGGNSSINNIVADGGGGGGAYNGGNSLSGGSGGGASGSQRWGTSTGTQGGSGGACYAQAPGAGGGGGGGNGGGCPNYYGNGAGGTGIASSIIGSSQYYVGGGAGGCYGCQGGFGGGNHCQSGTPNTGGGGGACYAAPGYNGGSGIVIIRYTE